jgi:hypothetical protein
MLLIFTFVTHTHYFRQRIHQDNSLWATQGSSDALPLETQGSSLRPSLGLRLTLRKAAAPPLQLPAAAPLPAARPAAWPRALLVCPADKAEGAAITLTLRL